MRHPHSHYKSFIRGRPSSQSLLAARRHRVLNRKFISTCILRITPMVDALDRALAEPDAAAADADVENSSLSSNSPHEDSECCLEGVVDDNDDTDDAEVETLLFAPPSPSSSLVRPSLSPPRTYVDTGPPMRDGSPEVPSPPSYPPQCHPPGPSETCRGGASSAAAQHGEVIVKSEEDQDDEMLQPSPVAEERPLEPAMPLERYKEKKALITFPGMEIDEEMYTVFDYVVEPDPERHKGNISQLSIADSFEGVTSLTLSFECPGTRDDDEDGHQERRPDAVIETLQQLGAVLGRSLRGLDVTAPWPELSFPCVPGILEVILGSFPALGNVRFADLQCGCANCESEYMGTASFRRLQVAALEHQVSGPLTAAMLQTVVIEKKSMHSLGKDFMKYIGDADQLADEALFGTCTVTKGEDATSATARSQQEALFLIKVLKRHLPSTHHFLVVTHELQVLYDAPSSPAESSSAHSVHSSKSPQVDPERDSLVAAVQSSIGPRTSIHREGSAFEYIAPYTPPPDTEIATALYDPSFDLSGDISPWDDISDEPAPAWQDMDHIDKSPQSDTFTRGRDGRSLGIQPQCPDDVYPSFTSGIQGVILAGDRDLWSEFISMTEDDCARIGAASPDIGVVPSASCPVSGSSPAGSLFSDGGFYSAPSSSPGLDDPGQHWVGDVDHDELHTSLEDTANAEDAGLPPGWLQYDDSAVTMSDEFHLDAASYAGPMGSCAGLTDFATTVCMLSNDAAYSALVDHLPACGYLEARSCDYGIDPDSDLVSLDGNVEPRGENGEPGLWEDMDVFVS